MTSTHPGVTFAETMSGAFALGETSPERGQDVGRQNDARLALHATVSIDNVDRFVEDPDHEGELTGSIEYEPFGGTIEGGTGVFKLFAPSDEEDLKLMVYELPLKHDGTAYYLAGEKRVRDDPGFDVWSDTTTLYTRLHEGTDRSGSVVGAGILSIGVDDLIDSASTMQAVNAPSPKDEVQALTTFGRFFFGELWDTYATHLPVDLDTEK